MKKVELVVVVFLLLISVIIFHKTSYNYEVSSMDESVCPVEYGEIKCVHGQEIIPFFNPNNESVRIVYLEFYQPCETKIYYLNKTIHPNSTYYGTFDECEQPKTIKMFWICENRSYLISLDLNKAKEFVVSELERATNVSLYVEPVSFTGSTDSGGHIIFRCLVSSSNYPENVSLWIGKCKNKTVGCTNSRDYEWLLNPVKMIYNETSGYYEYEWVINASKGDIIGSTCLAKDIVGRVSNWGDSFPLFTVSKETYPEHPRIEDCEKLKTGVQNFCYADVAEITGEKSYCEKIWDPEIKSFCIARLDLNEEGCKYIKDKGLKDECLFSINLKKKWMGLK
ncbi:MAG: hypothetical protein J7L45_03310 [Candidatus Aenigmarchaeota archaeon]|nr:hypothetical protein [Candidatus Aenigmarchaeota archaeon]